MNGSSAHGPANRSSDSIRRLQALTMCAAVLGLAAVTIQIVAGQAPQPAERVLDEARTVYLGNLARRANGAPPLRWNRQLTDAARWFSWDSTENRAPGFCGHQDTNGQWPGDRARIFGYKGFAGAENAFCGYVSPEYAIEGWMNSPGHRANLLDPNSREIGLGYYRRASDGRGYVTQDFGVDAVYPPLVVENEAVTTTAPLVNLYIYDRAPGGGFRGMGPATQMKIANEVCLSGAAWQPYTSEKAWTLASGAGWREVYVTTRDSLSRTVTVSDSIYLGASTPLAELGYSQMSTTRDSVTIYGVDGGGLPRVQLSLGWAADDTFDTFSLLWGTGQRITETAAWGGTAYRLSYTSTIESSAWVWTTEFVKDAPMTAYVRLKVGDNSSSSEVARVSVTNGTTLSLRGADFTTANQYQEFPLDFTFPSSETFLIFQFWRSGLADVTVDGVSIFTASQPATSTLNWAIPGGNYRGQGVWMRYTNDAGQFTPFSEADTRPRFMTAAPASLFFLAEQGGAAPPTQALRVTRGCASFDYRASDNAAWLLPQANGDEVLVSVNQAGLSLGAYQATLTLEASDAPPVPVPVTLLVAEQVHELYLPVILRNH
jgi:uncharacterized protein YkwD